MGLHLNFELRLPAVLSRAQVIDRLELLRAFALGIPVSRVTPLFGADHSCSEEEEPSDRLEGFFRLWTSILADPPADDPDASVTWDEGSAVGFVVNPGRGSEVAPIGFLRGRDDAGTREEWYWHTCCKTQYASVVSEAHLVRCHTALVSILDHAIELGIDVVVRDETGYWESRDTAILVDSVRRMNHIVAMFAGKLSDDMPSVKIEAPIFEHPQFEHIEMEK